MRKLALLLVLVAGIVTVVGVFGSGTAMAYGKADEPAT